MKNYRSNNVVFYIKELGKSDYTVKPIVELLDSNIKILHSTWLNRKSDNSKFNYGFRENVECINISLSNIFYIFNKIINNTDVVIFFGHNSFIEFILSVYCKLNSIKTIYVQHGLFIEQNLFVVQNHIMALIKYFHFFCYFLFVWARHLLEVPKLLYKYLYFKSHISYCTYNLFFDEKSRDFLICVGEKHIIGRPSNLLYSNNKMEICNVSYIQQGFIAHGITSLTRIEEREMFKCLVNKLKGAGFNKIQFFLHPREKKDDYNYLNKWGISIYQGKENHKLIRKSSLVIGHYSTLLDNCFEHGLNVIRINYPKLKHKHPGLIPFKVFLKEEDISNFINNKQSVNLDQFISFDKFAKTVISYI